jgi:two-component system OmpR family response regulator
MEDNAETAAEISLELSRHGFEVTVAADGHVALEKARHRAWAAFVVDRLLPGIDGLAIIRTLRGEGNATPALVLSALDAVAERIDGLRAGGDDYLTKPFALGELTARVEALLRRPTAGPQTTLKLGPLTLNLVERIGRRAGRDLELLGREFQILEYLARRPGQVVTRQMMLEDVFGYRFEVKTNLLDVHVGRLRRKIDMPGDVPLLSTIRGVGFRLDPGG